MRNVIVSYTGRKPSTTTTESTTAETVFLKNSPHKSMMSEGHISRKSLGPFIESESSTNIIVICAV